jgi:hypothetical protein
MRTCHNPAPKSISKFGLDNTVITDAGLSEIGGLPNLHYLFLRGTQDSDEGLARLKPLANLKQLQLKGTKVTDAGVAELHTALPNLSVFR